MGSRRDITEWCSIYAAMAITISTSSLLLAAHRRLDLLPSQCTSSLQLSNPSITTGGRAGEQAPLRYAKHRFRGIQRNHWPRSTLCTTGVTRTELGEPRRRQPERNGGHSIEACLQETPSDFFSTKGVAGLVNWDSPNSPWSASGFFAR